MACFAAIHPRLARTVSKQLASTIRQMKPLGIVACASALGCCDAQADATVYAAACCEAILMSAMKTAAALALDPGNDRYRRGSTKRHERVPAAFLQLALRVDPVLQELWRDWLSLQQVAAFFLDSHAAEQLEADGHEVGGVIKSPGEAADAGFGPGAEESPVRLGQKEPRAASSGRGIAALSLDVVEERGSDEEAETSQSLSHQDAETMSAAAAAATSAAGMGTTTTSSSPGAAALGLPEDPGAVHDLSQRRWARQAGDAITEVEASQLLTAAHPALTADNNFALLAAAMAREVLRELCRRSGIGAKLPPAAAAPGGDAAAPEAAAEVNAHKVAAAASSWLPPLARALCEQAGRHAVSAFAMVWKPPEKVRVRVTWVKGAPGSPAQVGGAKTTTVGHDDSVVEACEKALRSMRVDPARVTLLWRGSELPKVVPNPLSTEEAIQRLEDAKASTAAGTDAAISAPAPPPPSHVAPTAKLLLLGEEMEVFAVEKRWWEHRRRETARRGMLTSTRNQSSEVRHIRKKAESKVRRMREWADGAPTPPKPHDSPAGKGGKVGAGAHGTARQRRGPEKDGEGERQERRAEGKALYDDIYSSGYGQGASPAKPNRWAKMREEEEAKASEAGSGRKSQPQRSRLRRPEAGSAKSSPRAAVASSGYGSPARRPAKTGGGAGGGAGDPDVRAARALLRSCTASQPVLEAALRAVKEVGGRLGEIEGLEEAAAAADASEAADVKANVLAGLGVGAESAEAPSKVSSLLQALQDARATMDTALRVVGKVESRGLLGTKRK